MLSRGGNIYADALLGLGVRDSTAGFRAYAATVLRRIDLSSVRADSYGFQIEMTYRAIGGGRERSGRYRSVSWTGSSGPRRCPPTPSSRRWPS